MKLIQACLQGKVKNASQSLFEHARLSHSRKWINDRAELLDIALKQKAKVNRSISQHYVLEGMITLLLAFQSQLEILETQMEEISVNQLIHTYTPYLVKTSPIVCKITILPY